MGHQFKNGMYMRLVLCSLTAIGLSMNSSCGTKASDAPGAANQVYGSDLSRLGPLTIPSAASLTGTSGNARTTLRWSSGGGDTKGYLVVRRTTSKITWIPTPGTTYKAGAIDTTNTAVYVGTSTSTIDFSVTNGVTYYYAVFSYDVSKIYGDAAAVSVTPASVNQWTWVGGPVSDGSAGTYGTKGTGSSGNVPGARYLPVTWVDTSGNLWLFGGECLSSSASCSSDLYNDLWKFDGTNWTWISGKSSSGQFGTYGTMGTAASSNVPGGRFGSVSWIDSTGNLWLFGGIGYDVSGQWGALNDLWKYDGSNWTWVSGSSAYAQNGTYGTKGTAASGNVPGSRYLSNSWIDSSGNLWLFGGYGYSASESFVDLNDLWKYDGSKWTWVSGSSTGNVNGTYGTKATAASTNVPGSRYGASSWIDSSNNLWLFGGEGYDGATTGSQTILNDLWKYDGSNWTWVSGSSTGNQGGTYGTKATSGSGNVPGARLYASSWYDGNGNVWLFGGWGYDSATSNGSLNDLWKYDGTNWTWISGSSTYGASATYGTLNTAASGNTPGARLGSASWFDVYGNLWLMGGALETVSGGTTTNYDYNDLWKYHP